ncbi:hypothetical protein Ocin01_00498 [Orchesella cincta]|uniref:Uncharacterized protein n=1 Tax=Orchesella cincta TaxID=48709 RepID=A0A1D2NLR5_ORCCI|nr:hypothetical protein Ocin01_00498 [Orchesella cincta]
MKTFSVIISKIVLSVTLLVHVFLSVVLTVPIIPSFPNSNGVDNGHFRNIRHSHSHNIPPKTTSSFQGTGHEHVNYKREQAPEETQPIAPNIDNGSFKGSTSLEENKGINPSGSSNTRKELEEKSIPHFHFVSNQQEPVNKLQSQIVNADQNKEEKLTIDAYNGNRLQKGLENASNQPAYNLDYYYEDGIEARLSTATLIPDVQLLLQKYKESPHLDSIPDYSHLEFPKDTTEPQNGPRTKHRHGPTFNIKNPVDSIGTWSPQKPATPATTTVKPTTQKPIVQSETKILLSNDVVQVENPKSPLNKNINLKGIQNASSDAFYKKVLPDVRNITPLRVKLERTSSVPFIVFPETVGNRPIVKEEQKIKAGVVGDSGLNTVMDYPVDYLELEDYDLKELKSINTSTTAKPPQLNPIPPKVTDILPILKAPSNKTMLQGQVSRENNKIEKTHEDSSIFLIDLPPLDTELRAPNDNIDKTITLLDAELESSSSEENNSQMPINEKGFSVKPEHGTNSTNTKATQIDIILEIRAPSIVQPNPSSSDLKPLEQTFSVPLGKRYVHHNHTKRADSQ